MDFDFQLILTSLLVVDVVIIVAYKILARGKQTERLPFVVDQAWSFFPVLLFVWVLRSFIVEPYRIPSSSLEPTLLVGDLIVVNKFKYGIRSPVANQMWLPYQLPKRGDVVVFRWPVDDKSYYIKRAVAVAGDKVAYKNRTLYVNGVEYPQKFVSYEVNSDNRMVTWKRETIGDLQHDIHIDYRHPEEDYEVVVPEGHFFGMGDNRSFSADTRYWGFIPYENIIGNAFAIWMSWDSEHYRIRWGRLGQVIH